MANKKKGNWEILREQVYDTFPIFSLRKSTRLNLRSNKSIDFVLFDGLDWVNVIPITEDNQVVLVRQYRHGCEDFTIEIPGGCVEKGEDPMDSARRELLEETGYTSDKLELLGSFHPNPPMYSMRCSSYVARCTRKIGEQELDGGEAIDVLLKPFDEFIEMVKDGRISHGLVIAAVGLYVMKDRNLASK
jgi:ADP-ribose pyrophosphatase